MLRARRIRCALVFSDGWEIRMFIRQSDVEKMVGEDIVGLDNGGDA